MFLKKGAASHNAIVAILLPIFFGCSAAFDPTTTTGKNAIFDAVSISLTRGDCSGAIALIRPVYESVNTDNHTRMLMASSYGCEAHINFFTVLGDVVSNSGSFTGSGFWEFLSTEFPSTTADRVAEAAQLGQDALHASIGPSAVVLPANLYNTTGFNPATLNYTDRTSDANSYLFFISMAAIGAFENRYGAPYPNGKKSVDLPWITPETVTADGCAYASAVVNFVDSLGGLAAATTGSTSATFASLQDTFKSGIFAACDTGCTACGLATCPTCPLTLRNRSSCDLSGVAATAAANAANCAAQGITEFMNTTPVVGWLTGP